MRFAVILSSLVASAVAISVNPRSPTPTLVTRDAGYLNINPDAPASAPVKRLHGEFSRHDTNAKRLAAGLPLKAPRRAWTPTRPLAARQTGTPCTPGVFQATINGAQVGYVSNALNQFGEYGAAIADLNDPSVLQVCLQVPSGQTGSIDITALNSPFGTNTPFFGAINGWRNGDDTLGTGNSNYIYLGQTAQTDPVDSSAVPGTNTFTEATNIPKDIESGVWHVDTSAGLVELWWTNPDGTPFKVQLFSQGGTYGATGDFTAFTSTYGPADTLELNFVQI